MTDPADGTVSAVGDVTVRYWAAARAAAGIEAETVPVEEGATLADVLAVCSVLVGDRPVGSRAPEDVSVWPGQTVEMLPPFAGG